MVTPTKGARLGSSPAHERLILANLAQSLYEHGSIKTTLVRAKRVRPLAERLITIAKKDTLAARRQIMTKIPDRSIVHLLMTDLAEQFKDREGGYTRIIRTERRKGDQAEMAIIELISEPLVKKAKVAKSTASQEKSTTSEDENISSIPVVDTSNTNDSTAPSNTSTNTDDEAINASDSVDNVSAEDNVAENEKTDDK